MDISGTQTIPVARAAVWDALNDPAVLKACLPGCESVERTSPEQFRVVVAAAIGPLRARFNGTLRIADAQPPSSCVMVFEGQGGAVGFGSGSSTVTLKDTADGTELSYTAQAQVGGKLAQVGSRLIDSVARKMADDFFKAFRAQLAPVSVSPDDTATVLVTEAATPGSRHTDTVGETTGVTAVAAAPAAHAPKAPSIVTAAPAVMVPGWWLALAATIGSLTTLGGVWIAR